MIVNEPKEFENLCDEDYGWAEERAPQFASEEEAFLQSVEAVLVSEGVQFPLAEPVFATPAEELWLDVQAD